MSLVVTSNTVPLKADANGVVRVGNTRVTLDTVVVAFHEGATAEEIVEQYPTLRLADVYSVIGYYLDHQAEVTEYLRSRQQVANATRLTNESLFAPDGLREHLLKRANSAQGMPLR